MYINGDANSLQYILNESLQKQQKILPSCRHDQGGIWIKWWQGCGNSSEREKQIF